MPIVMSIANTGAKPLQEQNTDTLSSMGVNPKHVLLMASYIFVVTILIVGAFTYFFKQSENKQVVEAVTWKNEAKQVLKSGPVWFSYDDSVKLLKVKGIIDDSTKIQLLALYPADSAGFDAYRSAIDLLAFRTQTSNNQPSYLLMLLLGGLAAMIGVQIRTIYHFLDHACYKKNFDAVTWWPWYVVRPWVGFLLGAAVILLAEVNLFSVSNAQSSQIFWIGFSILTGFSTPDVIRRLGKASEAIFGIDDNPRPSVVPPVVKQGKEGAEEVVVPKPESVHENDSTAVTDKTALANKQV